MKSLKFLLAIFTTAVLMVSCATTQNTSDEDFDESTTRRIGNRVYVDDPYYGTVVLERDPFTGRYYDVTMGNRGSIYSPYNRYNTYNRYNNNYRGYRNTTPRYYRNNSNSGGSINGSIGSIEKPAQDLQKTREEARKKILGN